MNFLLTEPEPFEAAVDRLESRVPVAARLRTRGWDAGPDAVRDRAFFSAGVEDARVVATLRGKLLDALRLEDREQAFMDRSKFVAEMRRSLGAAPGDSRALTDIASRRRLELIYDTNVEEAYEFGRHKAGMSPELLDAYPARELVRVEGRRVPRDWESTWQAAGGRLYGGRMIARRDDPVWVAISRFGRPWPPFDFGSGMGVEDVERDEAVALGVIREDEMPAGEPPEYNAKLEASARDFWKDDPARGMLKDAFGDQIAFVHGRAVWDGEKLGEMFDVALRQGANAKGTFHFGLPSARARQVMPDDAREIVGDRRLAVHASNLYHAIERHGPRDLTGPGSGETRRDQVPLARDDILMLNQVWMSPDRITRDGPAALFSRRVPGGTLEMVLDPLGKTLQPISIRKKKKEQGPQLL